MSPEMLHSINKCKLTLLSKPHSAFLSSMLYNLKITEDSKVKTIALATHTEVNQLLLNPIWFNALPLEHQLSSLMHIVLHYALQHDLRRGLREPKLYQKACDEVCNNMLEDMNYSLPEGETANKRFKDKALEAVYQYLEAEHKGEANNKGLNNSILGYEDSPLGSDLIDTMAEQGTDKQRDVSVQVKRNMEVLTANMAEEAQLNKSIGDTQEAFKSLFNEIQDGKLDWRTILASQLDELTARDLSYIHFNRRYLPYDLYLPDTSGIASIELITLAFDISGSVSKEEVKAFLNEIRKIKQDIEPEKLRIITFNTKIQEIIDIDKEDEFDDIYMKTGGGTNLAPVFKHCNMPENTPKFLIVFSDLECAEITEIPSYPVIWICINNKEAVTHFGKCIYVTSKELLE